MQKIVTLLIALSFAVMGVCLPVADGLAGEAKEALERALIGQWKVPKNKWKEKITFDFTAARKFECVHEMPKKDSVTWSGDWKVRTTSSGSARAYLKARNQADPEKYMKAVIASDKVLEKFTVDIRFNFKSDDKSRWTSKLKRASDADDADDEMADDEFEDDEFEDEDFEDDDFEDEDFEDEEDEDFEDEEDEDLTEDDEFEEDKE